VPTIKVPSVSGGSGSGTSGGGVAAAAAGAAMATPYSTGLSQSAAIRRAEMADAAQAANVNITVNGAIDPISTARQIANILNSEATTSGTFNSLGISRAVALS
jgi:hypothetical protein